ncbi:hypothetical protein D9758_016237 [Tetrapyrgos nigripes]|uniref:Cytochrome P450 n=1 Tax=Tetrapyrgos nigripes TaxID=182062 RepID=A0A8H5FFG7_9AGAR|nr:hypothetical protein D9758_016237 [Tetrapyrgos nigripes]
MINFVAAVLAVILSYILYRLVSGKSSPVDLIPGPPSPSWFYGHMIQLLLPKYYGEYEYKWQERYGGVYLLKGPFSQNRLMISDPAALKFVLNDTATFERSTQQQAIVEMLIGRNAVFYVQGDDHRRIRNIMNNAFSPSSIRELPPIFKTIAEKVAEKLEAKIADAPSQSSGALIDIYHTIHSATLDGVGEGAIGYTFDALDNKDSVLGNSHQNIMYAVMINSWQSTTTYTYASSSSTMSGVRTKPDIVFEGIVPFFNKTLLQLAFSLPTRAFNALRHNRTTSAKVSAELIDNQVEALDMGITTRKDLLHVMVKGNRSAKASAKMSNAEMQEQIPSLMIAGQDTTGNTISLALIELGRDHQLQDAIRKELAEAYSETNGNLTYSKLESLLLFNAFLKEVLRLHPGLPMSDRTVAKDTIIPLSRSIYNRNGARISEIPVSAGQHIIVGTASYNRLTSIWGPDAQEFRPSRWLKSSHNIPKDSFGPFAGLATFLGGPRTCIGWRFALTEFQVMLSVLILRFRFTLPKDSPVREVLAVTLAPANEKNEFGLPLLVERLED